MEYHKLSVLELNELLDKNQLTSVELVKYFLAMIEKNDKKAAKVNSILEINPEALLLASASDAIRRQKSKRSKLEGIPILLKDNISTADMMHTSAGSLALATNYAKKDAHIVKKLREAGAIILGKVNMTEWANFMAKNMKNGYSSRGGQVRNPYGLECFDVGGSSSGSAASVASGMAPLSIGTETFGSILSPASSNMLVGIKPTVGLISRAGIIPISPAQDVPGPIAKTVKDAAILLESIMGYDCDDQVSVASRDVKTDYLDGLDQASMDGKKIGVLRTAFKKIGPAVSSLMEQAIKKCADLGATIVEDLEIERADELDLLPLIYEFKPAINNYLDKYASSDSQIKSLSDIINFNYNNHGSLKFGQYYLLQAEEKSGTLSEAEYLNVKLRDLEICEEGLAALFAKHKLDALILPGSYGSGITARAGYPSINVPAGKTEDGRPFGISFCSTAFNEKELIKIAYCFEQNTKHRKWPEFINQSKC